MHDTLNCFFDLDLNHYIRSTGTGVRTRDCECLTSENYYQISFVCAFSLHLL